MKRLYVAGKSGGHIIPGLTVARRNADVGEDGVYFVALDRPLDRSLLKDHSWIIQAAFLHLDTIYPYRIIAYPTYLMQWICALYTSWKLLSVWKPDEVISMGGYVSLPICYSAWIRGIPIHVYELNVEMGTAARLIAPLATEVYCCFHETQRLCTKQLSWCMWRGKGPRITFAPYPVRYSSAQRLNRVEACKLLGFDVQRPLLLVLGGSQGSHALNELILQWITSLSAHMRLSIQVIHQTGVQEYDRISEYYAQHGIRSCVFSYRDNLATCYAAADCAVSRAGSGAIHELEWFDVRTLLLPLRAQTTEHQYGNARAAVARNERWSMADVTTEQEHIMQWLKKWVCESS